MSAPSRIDEVKARLEQATPGPWHDTDDSRIITDDGYLVLECPDANDADAEFIASARSDMEYLLAEIDVLRQSLPAPYTCLQCGTANAKGGIVSDDDITRVLACNACCEKTADFYGRARAIKRAEQAEARVRELEQERDAALTKWQEEMELRHDEVAALQTAHAALREAMKELATATGHFRQTPCPCSLPQDCPYRAVLQTETPR